MQNQYLKSLFYSNRVAHLALALPVWLRDKNIARRRRSAIDAIEQLKNLAKEDIVLRVDAFEGDFQMSPSSHLLLRILIEGSYEPELASLAKRHMRPDRDIIDVGANVGFYSVLAAKTVPNRKVLAIEPSAGAHTRLLANLKRNNVDSSCFIFNGLAGSSSMEREIQIIEGMEEYSSVTAMEHYIVKGQASRSERTPQTTIDKLVDTHKLTPGFIKIDVEGFEMEALTGAFETLKTFKPTILCEVSAPLLVKNGSSSQQLFDCLRNHGYSLSDPLLPTANPGDREYGDVLAVHPA